MIAKKIFIASCLNDIISLRKTHSFRRVFTKFSHQEVRWIYYILRSVCYEKFKQNKKQTSSTYRELHAVKYDLSSFNQILKNQSIQVNIDNSSACQILTVVSSKKSIQNIAIDGFKFDSIIGMIEKKINIFSLSEIPIYLSYFFFLYINNFIMTWNQSAFEIWLWITSETIKSQREEKKSMISGHVFFWKFKTDLGINSNKCFW